MTAAPAEIFESVDAQRGIIWPTLRPASRLELEFLGQEGAQFEVVFGDKAAVLESVGY